MYRIIVLTKGFVAVIDADDFRRVNRHSWYTHHSKGSGRKHGQPYARARIKGKNVYLHRFIMEAPEGTHVDHRNHQTLDCRKSNLKVTSRDDNMNNRRSIGRQKKNVKRKM